MATGGAWAKTWGRGPEIALAMGHDGHAPSRAFALFVSLVLAHVGAALLRVRVVCGNFVTEIGHTSVGASGVVLVPVACLGARGMS